MLASVIFCKERGVTLIELAITLAVLSIVLALGMPSYTKWVQGAQIRTAAESLQSGLNLARSEAVRRNTGVEFVLTNDPPSSGNVGTVVADVAGVNWLVRQFEAAAYTPSDFIQAKTAAEGASRVLVAGDVASITFNGLGRPTAPLTVDLTNPTAGSCIANGGDVHCLRVTVSVGGQIRMCDPSVAGADTRACPANSTTGQ
jgi:type IV fimbrial biogenesis protein FimT